ncbi:MAG: hypothetical protein PVSMB4_14000 [Ktedonobacterales bacterium]
MAQPSLLANADVLGSGGVPSSDTGGFGLRQPPMLGGRLDVTEVDGMTGTTGPRPAVRRPGENSVLVRGISEGLSPKGEALVEEVLRELNPTGIKKSLPRKEIAARLTQRLNGDEATAQKLIDQWYRARKAGRGSQG